LPVVLTLLVGLISAWQLRPWQTPPPTYTANLRVLVGVLPLVNADISAYDSRYYAWLTSEYLVDDFTEVVSSRLFAVGVNERLRESGIEIPPRLISGSANTGKQHRILSLSLSWGDPDQLRAIANAVVDEFEENAADYFEQLGTPQTAVTLLDAPTIHTVPPSLRHRLEFPLRLLLALIAGVVLVFVLDYLDDSVRGRRDLESLGMDVLASVPKK
jgi:capsular polysaccharide biosynthesis protein